MDLLGSCKSLCGYLENVLRALMENNHIMIKGKDLGAAQIYMKVSCILHPWYQAGIVECHISLPHQKSCSLQRLTALVKRNRLPVFSQVPTHGIVFRLLTII